MVLWSSPESFFDLTNFEHRDLFKGLSSVWQALQKLEGYLQNWCSQNQALCENRPQKHTGAYIVNPESVFIGEGTVVEPGAYIRGPTIIGKNCQIRHGAYIRGMVIVGDHAVVGHATELKHSILLNHAKAAHLAFVGDSILGVDVNLGAGVKCANLRLNNQAVDVFFEGEKISTGMRKFGAIIGDGAQIGCNVVINPGTLIGKKACCFPSLNIKGVIPENVVIRPEKTGYIFSN